VIKYLTKLLDYDIIFVESEGSMQFPTENLFNSFLSCTDDSYRFKWIITVLKKYNIPYELQRFGVYANIICRGNSDVWLSAHFDTVDIKHCANDNSASVINILHTKILLPEVNIVFLDSEEPPHFGLGSTNFSTYIKQKNIPCKYILNLELTGFGNCICIGKESGKSKEFFKEQFSKRENNYYVQEFSTPPSDTTIFLRNELDSILLMTLPYINEKVLKECMYYCHTPKDVKENISFSDMDKLVKELVTILSYDIGVEK